ncbi:MAG: hypothetical protein IPL12_22855 [Bacteroidetes bacterium]|nr:hypothetical protein [Bacteroidota bacterium]
MENCEPGGKASEVIKLTFCSCNKTINYDLQNLLIRGLVSAVFAVDVCNVVWDKIYYFMMMTDFSPHWLVLYSVQIFCRILMYNDIF